MIRGNRKIYPVYFLVDIVLICLCFYVSYFLRFNSIQDICSNPSLPYLRDYSFIFVLWGIFIVISFNRRNLYATDRSLNIPREIWRVVVSVLYSGIIIGAVIFFTQYKFFSRQIYHCSFVSLTVTLSLWRVIKRLIIRRLISHGYHNTNVLVVGVGRVGKMVLEEISKTSWSGLRVVGLLDDYVTEDVQGKAVVGKLEDFEVATKKYFIDEVIITIPSEKIAISEIIKSAREMRLGVKVVPENFEEPLPVLGITNLGILPLLTYKEKKHHPAEIALKRILDFLGSLFLLLVLSPFFLLIAFLIKIDSRGPVFYRQKRVGFKGKIFNFIKFRSMMINADNMKQNLSSQNEVKDGVIFKMKDDPRVTRVGRIIRRYSLDELPQLINVLLGDMSLVGPRPPLSIEVEKYTHLQMQRLSIRPGMTGLSQVKGRSELTFRKWVKWDLWYINNWTFWLDIRILLWTVPAVIKAKGAY